MSAMAAAPPPQAPRLDSVLSFSDAPASPAEAESATLAFSDAGSGSDTEAEDADFEFAFAPPLSPRAGAYPALAPADDLFAHGRIVAAYPLFDRRNLLADHDEAAASPDNRPQQQASTAPPSPDTYCAWAPRSAPGSPSRDPPAAAAAFPKSSSTGEARRFWRLRDLVSGGGGRSHSDGKEKFVFLQPSSKPTAAAAPLKPSVQKQGKKQKGGKAAGATEMDMATAHRLFYGKPGAAAALAGDRTRQQQSYLPYRPGIVGFFATAHALGRSHHPY
ncbi:uncharacterized protein [Miscanthus floridulus]|uniref:uncharacterized protein n=1 Tax=Miscanthus floridulus TaxID=154761 RepID=UPI003458353C